ncbi:hypothetical protein QMK61_00175 [Fulvimonas sp. R45]|uniref:hypothetical protein n=1 Tax=Fulvimonas sp. R45 TaxID=3045937 RepID=UPI00265DA65B|nr:hypothetical protein [Fulvimonas sp. R45]MDO1527236.1 hypothetical protein [Fulvimonas sp. R45]
MPENAPRREPARSRLRDGGALWPSLCAGTLSTLAVALRSRRDRGAAAAGLNATSQWLWGRPARRRLGPSLRYTLTGYAVHQLCSFLWGAVFAAWNRRVRRGSRARRAAAVALLAAAVDYTVTPRRLRPGFEAHLSVFSMGVVYAAFAAGLCLAPERAARRRRAR